MLSRGTEFTSIAAILLASVATPAWANIEGHPLLPSAPELHLVESLRIDESTAPDCPVGSPLDVVVDPEGNIYVGDPGFERITIHGNDGACKRIIDRNGEGPGDLPYLFRLDMLGDELLVVGARGLVQVWSPDGNCEGSFRAKNTGGLVQSGVWSPRGTVYLTYFDVFRQVIVHEFSRDGTALGSFADSFILEEKSREDLLRESVYAGGVVGIAMDGAVHFLQASPAVLEAYDAEGKLVRQSEVLADFAPSPPTPEQSGDRVRVGPAASGTGIEILPTGEVLIIASRPTSSADGFKWQSALVMLSPDYKVLAVKHWDSIVRLLGRDSEGRIFLYDETDGPAIARYSVDRTNFGR